MGEGWVIDTSDLGLWDVALALSRDAARVKPRTGSRLPPLLFVTDPERTPDPASVARRLPTGAGLIHRGFGRPEQRKIAFDLAEVAGTRGLTLLIGLDAELAAACGAHGVHLPERAIGEASALRQAHPNWLITAAAHDAEALARGDILDAALVSPVFESASPSAGAPLGIARFTMMVRNAPCPVYALGGVTSGNARALLGSGACGLAAVEGVVSAFGGGTDA